MASCTQMPRQESWNHFFTVPVMSDLTDHFRCVKQRKMVARPNSGSKIQVSRDVLHHHDDNDDWGFLSETQGFSEARNIQRVEENRQRNKSQCLVNKTVLAITKMYSEYDSYMEQKYKRYLEQKVHQESPNVNSVVLMLPVIFLFPFPAHLTVISIVIEICLHLWAHRRAKTSPEFHQFHSPLHEITSKFCAVCRISDSTNKISKLQERRKERSRNYVERVSVAT